MFGKGIYFSDIATKSAQQCFVGQNGVGFLLLVKVAVGKPRNMYVADLNANKLPKGFDSTLGLGRNAPSESGFKKFKGMMVPCAKCAKMNDDKRFLVYNEYVVYDVAQTKLEYLLKVKFN